MRQDERWLARYNELKMFMEEHDMLNWLKANRKLLNAGKVKPERFKMFEDLLALIEQYKRVNQYQ